MINKDQVVSYCSEDISNIENYELAIAAPDMWECHHRLETHDENGNIRSKNISCKVLQEKGLYKKRPAKELIFLSRKDHRNLHFKGKSRNVTWGDKLSAALKDREGIWKKGEGPNKGKHFSEEWKSNIAKAAKDRGFPKLTKEQKTKAIENMKKAHCVKVLCIETGEVFSSIKEASEKNRVSSSCIIAVLKGKQKTAAGYHWKTTDKEILKEIGLPEDFLEEKKTISFTRW